MASANVYGSRALQEQQRTGCGLITVQASAGEKIAAHVDLLPEEQLESAQALVRLAFGTHLQLPNPTEFGNGSSCTARWYMDPEGVFAASVGAELVGVVFAINWGRFGFFGPLVINPEYWGRGLAQQLLERVMSYFHDRKVTHSGLFTFSNSPKHILLYQKYGFEPRFLTALTSTATRIPENHKEYQCYSQSGEATRRHYLEKLSAITDSLYPGLDLTVEIDNVYKQQLGETIVYLDRHGEAQAFALCHFGNRSEAQRDSMYVKFAAATGSDAFAAILDSCQELASAHNLPKIDLGINTSRRHAYKLILEKGYRPQNFGIAMEMHGDPGFNRSDVFAADDWR